MSPISLTAAAVPWLVMAWVVTIAVVALLIYLIVRAVLGKTEPEGLPEVLRALAPLIKGVTEALVRPFAQGMDHREQVPLTSRGQEGDSLDVQLLPPVAYGEVRQAEEDHSMPIKEIS
jgi:hypothetical protein